MIIREAKPEDTEELKSLAEKYKIDVPGDGKIVLAESSSGKIEAFVNIRPVFMIEPFVCENPLIGAKLWDYIARKSTIGGIKILRCYAQEKHLKLFKKLGFYRVFKKYIPMEINFFNNTQGGG
jgi:N-acetylglutamate synthase-like GNAT family acetyltransferase